ncbi:MAG TPA: L-histidine N(alpha)-methyltransferase [Pyrinomonadaceae bacterium]|nr:L-histidine N(alpha)-methyltransferase [Pyrinomonadaceae bacterium]
MAHTSDAGAPDERLRVRRLVAHDSDSADASFAEDVRAGLTSEPKRLSPKYFYDALGSLLFDAICLLPEYYLTRAEDEILTEHAGEIIAACGAGPLALLELGSGSAVKTRRLVEAALRCQPSLTYVPVDISASALEGGARALLGDYAGLSVEAYAGDYERALPLVRGESLEGRGRVLALFLGSNVGNFRPEEAREFLRTLCRQALRPGDALLLGADLKKDPRTLEDAYDDPVGVTAAFNLNLLARINRELDADFDPRSFRHVARYDEREGRVEMHLESTRAQTVRLRRLVLEVSFEAGERVHTENSYKYDLAELSRLASDTGFERTRTWLDRAGRFSSSLFVAVSD